MTQVSSSDLYRTKDENDKTNDKTTKQNDVFKQFTEEIDILGLKFLCRPGIHIIRKAMYLLLILFGVIFAIYQIEDQVILPTKY